MNFFVKYIKKYEQLYNHVQRIVKRPNIVLSFERL